MLPASNPETSTFHIIQFVVVYQKNVSSGPEVQMQTVQDQVLEQHAAVTVHDALRQASSPRGEQHVQRVVERHRLHGQRCVRRCDLRPGEQGAIPGPRRDRLPGQGGEP